MRKIEVSDKPFNVYTGFVKLSTEQALLRMHNLKSTKEDDVYEVVKPIQFKVGETLSVTEAERKEDRKSVKKTIKKSK